MSIDRALNLKFPKTYFKFKSWPGIVMAGVSFTASFSMYFFLTLNDPLTGYQNHCGFYPTKSVREFNILLYVIMGIAVSNALADFVLLKLAKQEIMWK
uniref:G_PROTEIN_RECEP_F1_2 domain-containing protein n=1 Tax=Caenorhabditis tropicalis TaxID=1561998 RepID=A0A1I7UDJ3_9PELO